MNYSEHEQCGTRIDDEALIEAGLQLLPVIGKTIYAAISSLGQAYHLTPTQVKVLLHLGTHGKMTVGEIASALAISMPAASELVDRLVEAGHLVRTTDPADRRRVVIAATPGSQRISVQLRELRRAQLRHALAQLAPEERPVFIRSLHALVAGLGHCTGADLLEWPDERCRADSVLATTKEPSGVHAGEPGPVDGERPTGPATHASLSEREHDA